MIMKVCLVFNIYYCIGARYTIIYIREMYLIDLVSKFGTNEDFSILCTAYKGLCTAAKMNRYYLEDMNLQCQLYRIISMCW